MTPRELEDLNDCIRYLKAFCYEHPICKKCPMKDNCGADLEFWDYVDGEEEEEEE